MVLLMLAVLSSTAFSREVKKTGTTAAKFLSIGIGPRANAMGGAFSSISNDAEAMYWNPAGLAMFDKNQAIVTYTKMFADINLNYFGAALPLGGIGTFGLNVTALNYGQMNVTDEYHEVGTGEKFSAGSYAFGLSYARNITEDFLAGINIKYIREDISNSSADGIGFDIGTIFKTPFYGVRFSSSISNYGSKMQMTGEDLLTTHDPDQTRAGNNGTIDVNYATEKYDLPLKLQIGISRDFELIEGQRLTIAIDGIHPNDNAQYVNVGGELSLFNELVQLRGGYKTLFLKDSPEGLTLGFGLNYGYMSSFGVSLDYSFQKYKYLGNTHSFGLILKF
jgi:hypothetical protein